jgi:dodecin
MEHAVRNAIIKASETIHNMRWFQIIDTRGYIENNEIAYWQVTIKVGFTVDWSFKILILHRHFLPKGGADLNKNTFLTQGILCFY